VGEADLVVVSSAVPSDNPECRAAVERRIPVVARGAMLAELTGLKRGIAVVGSHGKTTTTAMIALVMERAGLDPTAVIGGVLSAFGGNARLGHGAFMVVEADESDRSFLQLAPEIAVLTNLDEEHLEAYEGIGDLEDAFVQFAARVPDTGVVIACLDDPRLRRLLPRLERPVSTYGLEDAAADVYADQLAVSRAGSRCRARVSSPDQAPTEVEITLAVPGRHNVQNALAALAVGRRLGVPPQAMSDALRHFTGAERRFQVAGEADGVTVIDDYAHHPTEIAAVLNTASLWAPRRLIVVFQPHRYTRTHRLMKRFGEVLAGADLVFLTEVYAASEPPIPGATAAALAEAVGRVAPVPVRVVSVLDEVVTAVAEVARPGDVVVTLGAGSIGEVAPRIVEALVRRSRGGRP
jgi:UDP-N-acetylmuramate--alanine ligase